MEQKTELDLVSWSSLNFLLSYFGIFWLHINIYWCHDIIENSENKVPSDHFPLTSPYQHGRKQKLNKMASNQMAQDDRN